MCWEIIRLHLFNIEQERLSITSNAIRVTRYRDTANGASLKGDSKTTMTLNECLKHLGYVCLILNMSREM